jgi:hypothetical protein
MQAMSPEINSVTGQANQQRKQAATMGTSRGGGTNAGNQQAQTNTAAQVSNLISQARPQAAQQLSSIGGAELSNAGNLLGLGQTSAANLGSLAGNSRIESDQNNQAAGQAAGELAMAALSFA